jgi:hypothetical protein
MWIIGLVVLGVTAVILLWVGMWLFLAVVKVVFLVGVVGLVGWVVLQVVEWSGEPDQW